MIRYTNHHPNVPAVIKAPPPPVLTPDGIARRSPRGRATPEKPGPVAMKVLAVFVTARDLGSITPSVVAIARRLSIRSHSNVSRYIRELVEFGYVRRVRVGCRATIEVLRTE